MELNLVRPLKRAMMMVSISAMIAVIPIALTAAPASAATACNRFTQGGVTFSVCIARVNSTTAQAQISQVSGTFVSGSLAIDKGGSQVASGCSGQFHPGNACSFNFSGGSGSYKAVWKSKNSGSFSSPTIPV
jgi:hypothetical protein